MINKILLSLVIASTFMVAVVHTNSVYAASSDVVKQGINDASGNSPTDSPGTINGTISTVINLLSAAVGVAAVIMIIIAGFRYVTSAGSAEATKGAKNTLLYAVIGLVVVALAQIIVHFVLNEATNPNASKTTPQPKPTGPTRPLDT